MTRAKNRGHENYYYKYNIVSMANPIQNKFPRN